MIRGSLLAAAVAAGLSLLLHGLGLNVVSRDMPADPEGATAPPPEAGGAFEDFAEPAPEAPAPEVTAPDPVAATAPTSTALVASDNPQSVTTPDTGTADAVAPDAAEPAGTPAPETAPPPEGQAQTAEETPPPEPVEPDAVTETAEAAPETAPDMPQEAAEEALQPDAPEMTVAALPEAPDIPVETGDETVTETAVTRSLRPPKVRPSAEALGAHEADPPEGSASGSQPATIQSSGLELLARDGISTNRARGNADTTNYAGRVLTQLNHARRIASSAQGTARVQFQIDPDGSVAWVRILTSSGSAGIEHAAAAQVRSSAPFPRPPDGMTQRLIFVYHSE